MPPSSFSRRDFLKLGGLGLGAIALNPFKQPLKRISPLVTFPAGDRLGRIAVTPNFNSTELKAAPDENQQPQMALSTRLTSNRSETCPIHRSQRFLRASPVSGPKLRFHTSISRSKIRRSARPSSSTSKRIHRSAFTTVRSSGSIRLVPWTARISPIASVNRPVMVTDTAMYSSRMALPSGL